MHRKDTADITDLKLKANMIRRSVVEMIGPGQPGHLGGSCSIAEIAAALYYHVMKHDPKKPGMPERDRLILSKGHCALAQYAALADHGYFDKSWLSDLKKIGAKLQGHPDMRKVPGIEAGTGSLGQGASIAGGMALALRLDNNPARVYVIAGDGELAEGQLWEAFMAAVNFRLDKLCLIVDKNGVQATGATEDRFPTGDIAARLGAFGFDVNEIDGHDFNEILPAFERAAGVKVRPSAIVARTVKGKGISFAENNAAFHNGTMTEEQYALALAELDRQRAEVLA